MQGCFATFTDVHMRDRLTSHNTSLAIGHCIAQACGSLVVVTGWLLQQSLDLITSAEQASSQSCDIILPRSIMQPPGTGELDGCA